MQRCHIDTDVGEANSDPEIECCPHLVGHGALAGHAAIGTQLPCKKQEFTAGEHDALFQAGQRRCCRTSCRFGTRTGSEVFCRRNTTLVHLRPQRLA